MLAVSGRLRVAGSFRRGLTSRGPKLRPQGRPIGGEPVSTGVMKHNLRVAAPRAALTMGKLLSANDNVELALAA